VIKWAEPHYLSLLLLIPLFIIGTIIYMMRKKKTLSKFADDHIIPRITDTLNKKLQVSKYILLILAFAFLVISLARPKWGEKLQIYKGKGIDVVIALDASKSMLAQDVKPDRLTRAKTEIISLLDNLTTDRVGITAFAGECYIMCPLTTDIEAAKLFLNVISPEVIPKPGTDLEKAISVSSSLFNPDEETHKALILFTDGDNLVGDPMSAVEKIKDQGVRLFTIGVGTIEGSPVPEIDEQGNFSSYKKDKDDKIVMSRLAERLLIILAKATDGRYFRTEGVYIDRLVGELDKIKKKEIGGGEYVEYEERYQYFLTIAFIFLFLSIFLTDRRGRWFERLFLLFLFSCGLNFAYADVGTNMRKGNHLCRKGKYEDALQQYQKALVQEPDNPKIHYNMARALYKTEKYDEAISEFELGLLMKDKKFKANSFYNIGNCQFRKGQLDAAINAYKTALLLNPDDMEAKQNLEFCIKLKESLKNQPQSDSLQQQQQQQRRQNQPQPQPQKKKGKINKEEAERILQALKDKEKENLKKSKQKRKKENVAKDW